MKRTSRLLIVAFLALFCLQVSGGKQEPLQIQAAGMSMPDGYEISNDLYFSTCVPPFPPANLGFCGSNGGLPGSAAKYLYVTCGNRVLSPTLQQDWDSIIFVPPGASPRDRWTQRPGDDIYVPDFVSGNLKRPANWNMDPIGGFTQAKMYEFLSLYGGIVIPASFNPLGQAVTVSELAGVYNAMTSAGLTEFDLAQTPLSNLPAAPKPADFPGEEISSLDSLTTVVEFTVPASPFQEYGLKAIVAQFVKQVIAGQLAAQGYPLQLAMLLAGAHVLQQCPYLVKAVGVDPTYHLPIVSPADPVATYKLRGWFIKGQGIETDSGELAKPLIIFTHGAHNSLNGPNEKCRNFRKIVYYLVLQGYSVLLYDHEGLGISEGWNRWRNFSSPSNGVQLYAPGLDPSHPLSWLPVPGAKIPNPIETGNAVNIFLVLDQLEEKGLIQGAKTTPVILYGLSQGAMISAKAMQLRFDTPSGLMRDYSGYNIRGIVDSDSDGGSVKFLCDTPEGGSPAYQMVADAQLRSIFDSTMYADGDIHKSIAKWPGYLGLKAVYDHFSPEGVVAAYNRSRGFKDIVMVKGWHGWGLLFEPNFSYVLSKMAKFCKKVTINSPAYDNDATTSLMHELCKAPDFDITMFSHPPSEGMLFGAHNWLERLVERVKKLKQL